MALGTIADTGKAQAQTQKPKNFNFFSQNFKP
jgi:hypothetical protein